MISEGKGGGLPAVIVKIKWRKILEDYLARTPPIVVWSFPACPLNAR